MSEVDRGSLPLTHRGVMLRRLAAGDLAAFQAYRNDPDVGRYQGWSPQSDEQAAAFIAEMSTCPLFEPGSWFQLGIASVDTAALLGDIGLHLAPDGTEVEIGFTLAPAAQGKGLGTVAVAAALRWVFAQTAAARVVAITDARNLPSIRLLRRVGMRHVATQQAVFRGEACTEQVYAMDRRDAPGA